jgi:hypothetical protein
MPLTKKLWKFWTGLNEGEIDWEFIYDKASDKEADRAFEILVERGFVISKPSTEGFPARDANNWIIRRNGGRIINPERDGNTFYFRSEKYADQYSHYLNSQKTYQDTILKVERI